MRIRRWPFFILGFVALGAGITAFAWPPRHDAGAPPPPQPHSAQNPAPLPPVPGNSTTDAKTSSKVQPAGKSDPLALPSAPQPLRPQVLPASEDLRIFVDHEAPLSRRVEALDLRVPEVTSAEDIAWVRYVLRNPEEHDTVRHEAIMLLTRSRRAELYPDLYEILRDPREEPRFRAFSAQALGVGLTDETGAIVRQCHSIVNYLLQNDKDLVVRRECLYGLVRSGDQATIEQLRSSGLRSPEYEGMRDLVIRSLHEVDFRTAIPEIRTFTYDSNETVRIAAINVLGLWSDEASRAAFLDASRSQTYALQQAGLLSLRNLGETGNPSKNDTDF